MPKGSFTALILAGNRCSDDPVAVATGASCKALASIDGTPMVEYVVDALERSSRIDDILVCLDRGAAVSTEAPGLAARFDRGELARIDAEPSLTDSVLRALKTMPAGKPLLVTTADHPLLLPRHVDEFVEGTDRCEADVAAAIASVAMIEQTYPGSRRTRIGFKDGSYSGCNLFALIGRDTRRAVEYWRQMESFRKRPWRLAVTFGPFTLARFLLRRYTLRGAIDRLEERIKLRLETVELSDADAATDVDSLEDLKLVRRILNARQRSANETARSFESTPLAENAEDVLATATPEEAYRRSTV